MGETQDIQSMNIKESFLLLTQYLPDKEIEEYNQCKPTLEEVYNKARFGIKEKFDIYDYINEMVKIKEKTGQILYRGKTINMSKFWTELEERNITIKKWLIENTTEEGIHAPYEIPQ